MLAAFVTRLVAFSHRFALIVVALALALTAHLGWYAASHFKINTDINQLLSSNLPWRKQQADMEKAFPHKVDNLVIVIDGTRADQADKAAAALAERLQAQPKLFTDVTRPDALPYFRKNGLLFLSREELAATLEQITQAQPMLGVLAADPSLRGLMGMLDMMALGAQAGQVDYAAQLDKPFDRIAAALEDSVKGQDTPLDLQSLTGGDATPSPRELRKFIIAKPVLDYNELEPGKAARDAVRKAVAEINPHRDVTVRMTGSVALSDEEFATVAEGTGTATIVSGVLVLVLLMLALRSPRIFIPIIIALVVGLTATSAFALFALGALNMISVAFAVMFIGIAVDFGIQFGVRYRDQHHQEPDHAKAMINTARIIALPLSMAAGSTALGFLAFMPTAYRGVSELGIIAGAGMVIAFILNITLLPALLSLFKPPAEAEAIGFRHTAPLDAFIDKHHRAITIAAFILAIAGLGAATQLRINPDPLDLKDPRTESVATMFDVMKDPDSGAYAVEALRPSLTEAQNMADHMAKAPEVDHTLTLASFLPDDQDAKLAMIGDARLILDPTFAMTALPAPSADEITDSIEKLSAGLRGLAAEHPSARRLQAALDSALIQHDPGLMQRIDRNLIGALQEKFGQIKTLLAAEHVTLADMTDDLKRDWVTADGRYRVQILPKGNARDTRVLSAFVDAVRRVAPDATGDAVSIVESGNTIVAAFVHAGLYAVVTIALLAFVILRRAKDVAILLAPLVLAGILTLATLPFIGVALNFANIIALPLLLSLGVSYAIYFVFYARSGLNNPLQSSMARAVLFSAGTVLVAFGSLMLSTHPGTASMGELLTVALVYSVLSTFLVLPALQVTFKIYKP